MKWRFQAREFFQPIFLRSAKMQIHALMNHGLRQNPLMIIHLITTGGTIEKVYSEQSGTVQNLDNKIDRYLNRLRFPDADVRVIPLMNKDSLEMTDPDRVVILEKVNEILLERSPIVITH